MSGEEVELRQSRRGLPGFPAFSDQSAWNALVRSYSPLIFRVARGYRLSEADAADVCQSTWLALLECIPTFDNSDRLARWLVLTARQNALRLIRRPPRETPALIDDEAHPYTVRPGLSPEDAAIEQETYEALRIAYNSLPEPSRSLLRATMGSAHGNERIASSLRMPVGSVGPQRQRILNHLREELAPAIEDRISADERTRVRSTLPGSGRSLRAWRPPQAGVTFRIGFDIDASSDRPWAWPRDRYGRALPVRTFVIPQGARVWPRARLIAPNARIADTAFALTPEETGPLTVRVLVYQDTQSVFLEEAVGVVSHVSAGSLQIMKARIW